MRKFRIGERWIGDGRPPYFIADIASNHDGDLERAFRLIELAKESGADAAKFQNFVARKIVSRTGFESLTRQLSHQASWKKPVYEVYQEASLPAWWVPKLKKKCSQEGMEYLSSCYDFESVDLVDKYVNAHKIGSGDITWLSMLEYVAERGKPVIIATGASDMKDVVRAMNVLNQFTDDIVLMQCNTNYTVDKANFRYINLNVLTTYRRRFPDVVLGLSDHTPGHSTILGALALGARVFEKHFTDDNDRTGPDHKFAMNPRTWREMVDRANELDLALGQDVKRVEENEREPAIVQRRCLRFTRNLPKGHVLKGKDLFPLRPIPTDGIPPFEIGKLVGKRLNKRVQRDQHIRREDID